MKKVFSIVALVYFSLSCNEKDGKVSKDYEKLDTLVRLIPTYDTLIWDEKVVNAIDSFVKESQCDSCINELYVDKILPDSILITLKARVYTPEYMSQNNSLFSSNIHGKLFYIYSGLEDILKGNRSFIPKQGDTSGNKFKLWTLAIKGDKITIMKDGGNPFFPATPARIKMVK